MSRKTGRMGRENRQPFGSGYLKELIWVKSAILLYKKGQRRTFLCHWGNISAQQQLWENSFNLPFFLWRLLPPPVLGSCPFISSDYDELLIPAAGVQTWTHAFACPAHTQHNADNTHIHINTHTQTGRGTHSKKNIEFKVTYLFKDSSSQWRATRLLLFRYFITKG